MSDYHGDEPYNGFTEYRRKYARGYRGGAQRTIGERPGRGNYKAKSITNGHSSRQENPGNLNNNEHGNDKGNFQGNDNNRQKGHGHGGGNNRKK